MRRRKRPAEPKLISSDLHKCYTRPALPRRFRDLLSHSADSKRLTVLPEIYGAAMVAVVGPYLSGVGSEIETDAVMLNGILLPVGFGSSMVTEGVDDVMVSDPPGKTIAPPPPVIVHW